MDTNKVRNLNESVLEAVSGGVTSGSELESYMQKGNDRSLIMNDLLQGLSFAPIAPECTDITR